MAQRFGPEARDDRDRHRYLTRLRAVLVDTHGRRGWRETWDAMRVQAAVAALEGPGPAVIDLGAGHATVETPESQERLAQALAGCAVVWLQPWPAVEDSVAALLARLEAVGRRASPEALRYALNHRLPPRLCTCTVYTEDKGPGAVAEAVCEALGISLPPR